MSDQSKRIQRPASKGEVEAFLRQAAKAPVPAPRARGRLIFALDATASREPTWDQAAQIQGAMFTEGASLGGLAIQLCYYRGILEFDASPWCTDAETLRTRMTRVFCAAGLTQIARVLRHAAEETRRAKVDALVFVGDCVEEPGEELARLAGRLGLLGVPAFVFQEGRDPNAERELGRIARLSGGAYCRFDASSPKTLRDLLSAVAVYAAGGRLALKRFGERRRGEALRLTQQIVGSDHGRE